jgi:hypothetical protein
MTSGGGFGPRFDRPCIAMQVRPHRCRIKGFGTGVTSKNVYCASLKGRPAEGSSLKAHMIGASALSHLEILKRIV